MCWQNYLKTWTKTFSKMIWVCRRRAVRDHRRKPLEATSNWITTTRWWILNSIKSIRRCIGRWTKRRIFSIWALGEDVSSKNLNAIHTHANWFCAVEKTQSMMVRWHRRRQWFVGCRMRGRIVKSEKMTSFHYWPPGMRPSIVTACQVATDSLWCGQIFSCQVLLWLAVYFACENRFYPIVSRASMPTAKW